MSLRHFAIIMGAATAGLGAPALAQSAADDARFRAAQERFERELDTFRSEYDRYQSVRRVPGSGYRPAPADPRYDDAQWRDEGDYDPSRYYRPSGQERALGPNDRVYSGSDGRYYCRRSDGTTGLIVGGALGGVLGNVIDGGRSRTVGTLLGGAAGALAGRAVDQSNQQIRCR
ncbi:glycine zipper 2TM domain-containing protein [Sphingomonas sp.]|jgi:hypothetical protein|uniref:glycine zipper 2TM domain-containing protein n=1 Tax=Sphingomonas sp. TaxID=28214 RepID=UPI0026232597|nr:glycine zipper 2TM domain-containing protein [Sphingomonas sp.]MDF2494090.1 hypothetical protein [Sphingomonas sp.]